MNSAECLGMGGDATCILETMPYHLLFFSVVPFSPPDVPLFSVSSIEVLSSSDHFYLDR